MAFFTSALARREAACRPRWRGGAISPCASSPISARLESEGAAGDAELAAPTASDLAALIDEAPPMRGGEYLRPDVLVAALARASARALEIELSESKLSLQDFLKARDSRWRLVGRVHFNLAENRRDPDYPFAFMATYTSGLSANGVSAAPAARPGAYANMPAPATRPSSCNSWRPFSRRARPAPG